MVTRTLLFDLARLDGTGTGPASGVVHLSLHRPQQEEGATITTATYPLTVDGPTRVEVPVTAPGNALRIDWPAGAHTDRTTYHLIPEGEGDLVAAELRMVDRDTLAPAAQPEPAWWAALENATSPAPAQTVTDNGDGTATIDLIGA